LGIVNYCGLVFPKWVGDTSFHRLARVSMRGCKNCTSLPPFGQLPSLKELSIQDMDNLKVVGSEFLGNGVSFPSLEVLSFEGMPGWKEWSSNGRSTTEVVRDVVFPCLKELRIEDCPSLDKFSFEGDKVFPCLKELRIIKFYSLVEFSFEGNEVFPCLKVLQFDYCPSLVEVSFKGDKVFPFLQELCIQGCSNLLEVSLEELPS
ncbi:NBS-LRR resistance-like protein, partial [Tanacetum coccineum]